MKDDVLHKEERNRRLGFIFSCIIHVALFLLFFIPFMGMIKFPPEDSGIMIIFGEPDAGQNSENYESAEESETIESVAVIPAEKNPDIVQAKTRNDESDIKAVETKKSTSKSKAETEAQKRKEMEKAENEKQLKEKQAREKEAADKKKQLSDLLGKGKGNVGKSGDQGAKNGEPNGKVLDGITKGSGRIGGGLSSRGLVFEPVFQDNSQRSGRVVLTICVDTNGKVISSKFTQKGSTTSDPYLIQITEKTASKYKFSPSDADSQCGTITVEYKVQ